MPKNRRIYGMPLSCIYHSLDKIETDEYILEKKAYRHPENTMELMRLGSCPGDYVILYSKKRNCVVMSDSPMERYTNQTPLLYAKGDVCILGLGIGMIIFGMLAEQALRDDEDLITSITIIEKDKALINLIQPLIENNILLEESGIKLNIINADAYEWPKQIKNKHFDFVYADIWDEYHGYEDEASIFDKLSELYAPLCDKFDAWGYTDSHGENPDDDSPIEQDEYSHWMAEMIEHDHEWGFMSEDIWKNIMSFAKMINA